MTPPRFEHDDQPPDMSDVAPTPPPELSDGDELGAVVGANLRRLRTRNGYSLERLAKLSGVSRAMLGQIELGRSVPTIALLWKVARALNVPFATLIAARTGNGTALLRAQEAKILRSVDGAFTSRALFPVDNERKVEFYELRVGPRHVEEAEAHAAGTTENLVVASGEVEIVVGRERYSLKQGDAIHFEADVPHTYRNTGARDLVKEEMAKLKGIDYRDVDPLILDMDGDGIELSPLSSVAPRFDVDGDGFAERTGWVRGDDALLVADLNGNGQVDGFYELFGSPNDSGFAELKAYDSNNDGKVDASDALWSSLKVWQDKDAQSWSDRYNGLRSDRWIALARFVGRPWNGIGLQTGN